MSIEVLPEDVQALVQADPLFAARLEIVMLRRVVAAMQKECATHEEHRCTPCGDSCNCRDAS